MRREEAISALRFYLAALRRDFGVRRIALVGSTARGDAREDSDLDILVDFETGPPSCPSWASRSDPCRGVAARRRRLETRAQPRPRWRGLRPFRLRPAGLD